jgi:hypothetical protein
VFAIILATLHPLECCRFFPHRSIKSRAERAPRRGNVTSALMTGLCTCNRGSVPEVLAESCIADNVCIERWMHAAAKSARPAASGKLMGTANTDHNWARVAGYCMALTRGRYPLCRVHPYRGVGHHPAVRIWRDDHRHPQSVLQGELATPDFVRSWTARGWAEQHPAWLCQLECSMRCKDGWDAELAYHSDGDALQPATL